MTRKKRNEMYRSPVDISRIFYGTTPAGDVPRKYYRFAGMRFSDIELKQFFVAYILLTVAFTNLFSFPDIASWPFNFPIAGIAVFTGFFLHELSHKYVAQRNLLWSEFRYNLNGLFLAVAISVMGFIWAAPGAVMISGYVDTKLNGKISIAGPMNNLFFSVIFFPLYLYNHAIGGLLVTVNLILAAFNLIPLGPLDGRKIWNWNHLYYLLAVAGVIFMFLMLEMF